MRDTSPIPDRTATVLVRIGLRSVLIVALAASSSRGFVPVFDGLMALAAIYCVAVAAVRGEAPFGPRLTHVDEAALYTLARCVAAWIA